MNIFKALFFVPLAMCSADQVTAQTTSEKFLRCTQLERDTLVDFVTNEPLLQERKAVGITTVGNLFELYVNEEEGSFTTIITEPSGQSCFVSRGFDYDETPSD